MRPFKRICFFLYSCMLFAGGLLCAFQIEAFFYPGREAPFDAGENSMLLSDLPDRNRRDSIEQTASGGVRLTASTKMVVRICNLDEGSERQELLSLPVMLIGCSRAETERFFIQFQETASLKEREAGFLNAELLSFSPEQIVVRKNYRKQERPSSFKLVVEHNMVTVYEQETGILYLRTALDARTLPPRIRKRVLAGYSDVSADSLEKFLVSYAEA